MATKSRPDLPHILPALKLFEPRLNHRLVARPHLLAHLSAGRQKGRPLTLVSAPAGYGKTTLTLAWLEALRGAAMTMPAVGWLSLEASDDEPVQFFTYLLAAAEHAGLPPTSSVRSRLQHTPLPPPEEMAAELLHALNGARHATPSPLIVVLDDFHLIDVPYIHMVMQVVLTHLPADVHVVLLTREDPQLPLARWRVENRLTEIRARDLRFSTQETAEFFRDTMDLDLSDAIIAQLEARTEGWAAGLQLAALSLVTEDDPAAFVQNFRGDDRQVVDYLLEEVLARQPTGVQRFLLHTSLLERICGPLCDALLAQDAGAGRAQLEKLNRRNLFLIPLDHRRDWYRYHHLFGELLRQHLRMSTPAAEIATLHRRAAQWHAEQGLAAAAVRHALAADDGELAAAVVEQALAKAATWSGGDVGLLHGWWRALPADALRKRPLLCLRISRALYLSGRLAEAERLLDATEATLRSDPAAQADQSSLLAQITIYRAAIWAMRGEPQRAYEATQAALPALTEADLLPRARAYDTLGLAYELLGECQNAIWAYLEASVLAERAGVLYLAINARCEAASVQITQGLLHQAAATCRAAIALGEATDAKLPPLGLAWSMLGHILREQGNLTEAEANLQRGIGLSQQGSINDDLRSEYLFLAQLRQAQGEYAAALTALQQVELLLHLYDVPRLFDRVAAQRVRVWLAAGHRDAAAHWAEAYRKRSPSVLLQEYEKLTLARSLIAEGEQETAERLLLELRWAAEEGGRTGIVVESLLLLARAQPAQERAAACGYLAQALELAAPSGYVRLFLDEGEPLVALLHELVQEAAAPAHARRLLNLVGKDQDAAPSSESFFAERSADPDTANAALIEPLTERELEVLRLLGERLTNQEIAVQLTVSLPTVKTHVAHIYDKLGTRGRRRAVARARALGMLD